MIIALRFGSIPYVFLMYSVRARQFDSEPTLRGAHEKFRKFFSAGAPPGSGYSPKVVIFMAHDMALNHTCT